MKLNSQQLFAPPDEFSVFETARFAVISVPVEATVSYGGGTGAGPAALIEASQQVELFDAEEQSEPYRKGIATLEVPPVISSAAAGVEYAQRMTRAVLEAGKIPLILGGEHSLTAGAVAALGERYGRFSLLHFDAHSDLRDTYHGDTLSHASVLRRCAEFPQVETIVQVGIRNISNSPEDGSEFDFIQKNRDRIHVYYGRDAAEWNIDEMIGRLGDRVYITFDVDGLDPSIMPATGTPEPGGLGWYQTLAILKKACAARTIIGMDFVEFAPLPGFHAPDFLLAKLIYKAVGFVREPEIA